MFCQEGCLRTLQWLYPMLDATPTCCRCRLHSPTAVMAGRRRMRIAAFPSVRNEGVTTLGYFFPALKPLVRFKKALKLTFCTLQTSYLLSNVRYSISKTSFMTKNSTKFISSICLIIGVWLFPTGLELNSHPSYDY